MISCSLAQPPRLGRAEAAFPGEGNPHRRLCCGDLRPSLPEPLPPRRTTGWENKTILQSTFGLIKENKQIKNGNASLKGAVLEALRALSRSRGSRLHTARPPPPPPAEPHHEERTASQRRGRVGWGSWTGDSRGPDRSVCPALRRHNPAVLGAWVGIGEGRGES